ncbi:MAG: thioredoxin domain-containing protein, partial [Deltaproteobacteria bacterium]|nr:thioredoxin domain-containing protein [Deltaproteobacteria bacterium]
MTDDNQGTLGTRGTSETLPGAEPHPQGLASKLQEAIAARGPTAIPRAHHLNADGQPRFTNRLAQQSSPYLLQHAHNPVNWFPWGDEAFAEARRLNRPVFLSIGYSTCHWCHVMEEESFEDLEIGAFINMHYVAIKVDREERPDIDAVYMSAVQQLTGSGGWPMSVWLNADREPFFGGTYFPPRDGMRGARHGFLTLLHDLADTFHRDSERVGKAAQALVAAVRRDMQGDQAIAAPTADTNPPATPIAPPAGVATGSGVPSRDVIDVTVDFFKRSFDAVHGGLRRAPKFPSNVPVRLLLRHHHRTGDAETLHMAIFTLEKMAAGGLYDQLGGGFHRYSTDARWLVPHFEKMLYDNALLVVGYAEAFQVTGRPDFARVVRETCDYVLREMTDPAGGFYSATDADSAGAEGTFFVWTAAEIQQHLGTGETARRFAEHYDVRPEGNWEGSTILNVPRPDESTWGALAEARNTLYQVRAGRVPPLRDEKILTAWNGLMISAMASAGRILDEPRYVTAAARAAEFVLDHLRGADAELQRSFKDGGAHQDGFLDDYAFLVAGLIDLYEATFEQRWLGEALALAHQMERRFADTTRGAEGGGWFMTSDAHETLIAREKPGHDGAEPSGTSVALMNAVRLAVFTGDDDWRQVAARGFRAHAQVLKDRPIAMTEALLALDFFWDTPQEIAVVWPAGVSPTAAASLVSVLRRTYLPSRALAGVSESEVGALGRLVPFVREKVAAGGHA